MSDKRKTTDGLARGLDERARELDCLYRIEELLNKPDIGVDDALARMVEIMPSGCRNPDICRARITIDGKSFQAADFVETERFRSADVRVRGDAVGTISIFYTAAAPDTAGSPFLEEEEKMLQVIAGRLGHFILHARLKQGHVREESVEGGAARSLREEWRVVLDLLMETDKNLFTNLSHKMLNHLSWRGIDEAEELLVSAKLDKTAQEEEFIDESNRPFRKRASAFPAELGARVFDIAARHMNDAEIYSRLQKWIQEDKLSFLVQVVNRNLSLADVADALRRYYHTHIGPTEADVASPSKKGIHVSLIRRFLSDQLPYINIAKDYIGINDFHDLIQNMIFTNESHGKLGGKSAGMYLAAQIIRKGAKPEDGLGNLKTPRTWYITSDMLLHFMHFNNLDEIVEQKYKEVEQVRFEYPHIIDTFKNSQFPPEILKGLSVALDDFGDCPLIVRSSSLLEDRMGAAFSGKYKSVFIANQGGKQKRLEALADAIAEVYASTFGPDPVEYRAERGLIDFGEEMGILIQEVVGSRVGDYFFPSFAGVAFSRNEFRWSPRIKREDGLVRMVPGLGTRAVDRLSDDYPILLAPGQPNLKVNVSVDDILRYSPRRIDVINLKKNTFETIGIAELIKEHGYQIPAIAQMVSIYRDDHLQRPVGSHVDYDSDDLVVTFDGLIAGTTFVREIDTILKILEKTMGTPVDIEFAHDGRDLYLLQCRPQSYAEAGVGAPIPKDVPEEKIIFSANRYISNGQVSDITHIVYVDPDEYGEIPSHAELVAVGRAIGKLNKLLPKRRFILMGPGRWGSRGDIKLGVKVTYSEINNTAVMIEVARQKGNYTPDVSFGTHFFQDLVEAGIRYIPLFPDDAGVKFNERFLKESPNLLAQLVPEAAPLSAAIRVIDVPAVTGGMVLRVLMNADLDQALAILVHPSTATSGGEVKQRIEEQRQNGSGYWRLQMTEYIASQLDGERFGVKGFYVVGSTKNLTAGSSSDIDILIHFSGTPKQRKELEIWLEGWSLCLGRMNYLRTGHESNGLLDVVILTDKDIEAKTGWAAKINGVTDPALELPLKKH
ncbi:MAG: pyruvate, phosphate dikinase [candidate division Zixibacteria bacterium]|nr:pyruvate, phosphate dikinase [candidate division Zixibacteria bacterium]